MTMKRSLFSQRRAQRYGYVANSSNTVAHGTHSAGYVYRDFEQEAVCVVRFRLEDVAIAEIVNEPDQKEEKTEE